VQSPQGATILLYGHENGVTIIWRGGRRFKPAKKEEPPKEKPAAQNGSAADDSVMIIDSDDDEPAAKPQGSVAFVDKPEFEEAGEQGPYPEIIQTLDLTFGTPVLNVAVMPVAPTTSEDAPTSTGAALLQEKMVFAVSCVTNDAYVVTLPLTPPSPESKARPELKADLLAGRAGSGAWGESLTPLGGQTKYSDGLAITLARPSSSDRPVNPPRAVVAAHSRQASGVLHLWDVPLDGKPKPDRLIEPFQTEFLPNPLTTISFNPTHATQLLTVSSTHAARIYDYALPAIPNDPEATGPFPTQGSWLLSLYQPFAKPTSSRKPILDATWVSKGHAIFVLLADGMWGIWDIDGVSPTGTGAAISSRLKSGVRGAALTAFSVSGYVEGTSMLRGIGTQAKEPQQGEFAPMTPHTRRQATASLSAAGTLDRLATVRGGVKATPILSSRKAPQDEALALWVGGVEHVCVIPAVSKFWDSQLRKGSGGGVNLFSGAPPTRMVKLADIATGLLGDHCCGLNLISSPAKTAEAPEGGMAAELVIRGESRFVIARDSEDGTSKKLTLANRPRRIFSKERPNAIIVHGEKARPTRTSFNLSTVKPGSLRQKSFSMDIDETEPANVQDMQRPTRSQSGFDFANTLSAAADMSADISRDVEAEMLGIMEIDQALDTMEGSRGTGRKKVFFE
jgi:hypothetical protein